MAVGLAALVSIGATTARTEWTDHARTLEPAVRVHAAALAPLVAGGERAAVARSVGEAEVPAASDAFVSGMRVAMLIAGALTLLAATLTALARPARIERRLARR